MTDYQKPSRANRRLKRTWKRPKKENAPKLAGRRGEESATELVTREVDYLRIVRPE